MRIILAFVLALITVLFAMDNQTEMVLNIGPFELRESVAIIVISTFILGVITGLSATLPSAYKRRMAKS